jgi:hypothetical protein
MAAFRVRFSSRLQNSLYPPSLSRSQDTVHIHAAFAARAARVEGATPKSGSTGMPQAWRAIAMTAK